MQEEQLRRQLGNGEIRPTGTLIRKHHCHETEFGIAARLALTCLGLRVMLIFRLIIIVHRTRPAVKSSWIWPQGFVTAWSWPDLSSDQVRDDKDKFAYIEWLRQVCLITGDK